MDDIKATKPLDVDQFRAYSHKMVDFIADYYQNVEQMRVRSNVKPGYLTELIPSSPPEKGETLDDILKDVTEKIMPGVTHWQSPNFFAYFPANSSTAGFLGEMLSGALNVIGFSWISSPASTELETLVLDWLAAALDLPPIFWASKSGGTGGGVIQGTASEAVLVAMLAARCRAVAVLTGQGLSQSEALGKLVAYTSDQAHSCVQKACMVAGIENFRVLPTDASSHWSLLPDVLAKAVEEDVASGKLPFFLCATVGTTSSTAVDPISELGVVAEKHAMWLHVDAAYAGSAATCPEFRHHFAGLDTADSFCYNAHKWMLTNFDCCCFWVKDSQLLVNALSLNPEYLKNNASESKAVVDYKDWQIPLGRRFRALKLWFVMRLYGIEGIQSHVRSHVAMANHFAALVTSDKRFEVSAPVTFALVCFRMIPRKNDPDNGKTLNAALLEAVNSSGEIFFTHTVLSGVYVLRLAIGATQTEKRHVDKAWDVIRSQAEQLSGKQNCPIS